jgi:hypothetical protein
VNGLRISLAVEANEVVVFFQNMTRSREIILPLGQILGGSGSPDLVQLHLVLPDGTRGRLRYTGGPGVVTGQILPYVVPMMAGSLYSIRTPLQYWRLGLGGARKRSEVIEEDLARGAALQAGIEVGESLLWNSPNVTP